MKKLLKSIALLLASALLLTACGAPQPTPQANADKVLADTSGRLDEQGTAPAG